MFVRDTQQQFRISNADVKMFYGTSGVAATPSSPIAPFSWNKPSGVSFIYMLLIGAGAGGNGDTLGGGSGAVTCWFGAARHIPDSLIVSVGANVPSTSYGADTTIRYRTSSTTLVNLLTANGASLDVAGTTSLVSTTPLGALGFYTNFAGQAGGSSVISPDGVTFLTGGANAAGTGNWGYRTGAAGMFQLQPVLSGIGGVSLDKGGIGCGGGVYASVGGPGMALIASW